jgi:signal transduction histidine kinase
MAVTGYAHGKRSGWPATVRYFHDLRRGARSALVAVAVLVAVPALSWPAIDAGRPMWWLSASAVLTAGFVGRALSTAYRAGCAAERARHLRSMHDTVLQSLEAIALAPDVDRRSAAEALAEVRGAARQEATALRRSLAELTGGRLVTELTTAAAVPDVLAQVIAELPAGAPRTELDAPGEVPPADPVQRDCLRDATRAALGNVLKHARAHRVVVRVAAAGGGVEVVVRDDGLGFDPRSTPPGFGLRQSITARLREAGGDAVVDSAPGRGTAVRLWVPAAVTHLPRDPRR